MNAIAEDQPATDLGAALDALTPQALTFEHGAPAWYVERPDDPLAELRTRLAVLRRPAKFLVAGHRGCGKSTELNRLRVDEEVLKRHRVVQFSVTDQLDINQLDCLQILLAALGQVMKQVVTPLRLELSADSVDELLGWQRRITEKVDSRGEGAESGVELGAKIGFLSQFFAGFTARLRSEHQTREVIKEVIGPRLSEFLNGLDLFFRDVTAELAAKDGGEAAAADPGGSGQDPGHSAGAEAVRRARPVPRPSSLLDHLHGAHRAAVPRPLRRDRGRLLRAHLCAEHPAVRGGRPRPSLAPGSKGAERVRHAAHRQQPVR